MNNAFKGFPKIPRLCNELITITEKVDGTNGVIYISDEGEVLAGCRTRWLTEEDNNQKFWHFIKENEKDLRNLGVGYHYGEWYGYRINRNYGLLDRRFVLFNPRRYDGLETVPKCCTIVPTIRFGGFSMDLIAEAELELCEQGSRVVPGFMEPEGLVVTFKESGKSYKVLFDNKKMEYSIK